MTFKDPPVQCGRLGIIGFKAFVAAHSLRPPDVICFHQAALPLHLNHYFVHCVRMRPQPAIPIGNDSGDDDDDGGNDGDDEYDDDDDGNDDDSRDDDDDGNDGDNEYDNDNDGNDDEDEDEDDERGGSNDDDDGNDGDDEYDDDDDGNDDEDDDEDDEGGGSDDDDDDNDDDDDEGGGSEGGGDGEPNPCNGGGQRGGTNYSDFTLENFLFEVQLRPDDVEKGKITLSQTAADHLFAELANEIQPDLLLSDCHKKTWLMKFKDPPVERGRLGLIGLKPFVASHKLQPPDLIRFHKPAQPMQINHYFVDCVKIRPRIAPQPAIRIGNDGGDDDDNNGGGGKRGDGGPNSSNRDKGKGVDCARTRPSGAGSKRGRSSSSDQEKGVDCARTRPSGGGSKRGRRSSTSSDKGKGVINRNERAEMCLFEKKQLTKDVVGPSMEEPISLLQAELGALIIF